MLRQGVAALPRSPSLISNTIPAYSCWFSTHYRHWSIRIQLILAAENLGVPRHWPRVTVIRVESNITSTRLSLVDLQVYPSGLISVRGQCRVVLSIWCVLCRNPAVQTCALGGCNDAACCAAEPSQSGITSQSLHMMNLDTGQDRERPPVYLDLVVSRGRG